MSGQCWRTLIGVLLACGLTGCFYFGEGYSVINDSGVAVTGLEITNQSVNGELKIHQFEKFKAGESARYYTTPNVQVVWLEFTLNGKQFKHRQLFDLWAGEHYTLTIQPDGKILGPYGDKPQELGITPEYPD